MKKVIGYFLAAILGYAGGVATCYLKQKKTAGIAFEEISEEEQAAEIAADAKEPVDIEKEINKVFDGVPAEENRKEGIIQLDTQKVQYFKQWKAEEAADKYDTRTTEEPADAVTTEEDLESGFDKEFLDNAAEEAGTRVNRPDIEAASIEDWDHWVREQDNGPNDPEYECAEILWFTDGMLTDEEGSPIERPGKFVGFDVIKRFNEIDEETTGDPDVRIVYNHKKKMIFQITRKHCAYDRKTAMEEFGSEYGGEDEDDYE